MKLPGVLAKKVGPWPVGVWLIIVIAGAAVGLWWTRRNSLGGDGVGLEADPFAGDTPASDIGGIGALDPATLLPGQPGEPIPRSPITDNSQWLAAAVRALLEQPEGGSAFAIQQALTAWLEGSPLTAAQRRIVDRAVLLVGPPPDGAPVMRPPTVPPSRGPGRRPTIQQLSVPQLYAECKRSAGDPHQIPARFSASEVYAEMFRRRVNVNGASFPKGTRCAAGFYAYALARR